MKHYLMLRAIDIYLEMHGEGALIECLRYMRVYNPETQEINSDLVSTVQIGKHECLLIAAPKTVLPKKWQEMNISRSKTFGISFLALNQNELNRQIELYKDEIPRGKNINTYA